MAAADGPPRTTLEFAIAERNAVALGASLEQLMGEAGRVLAEAVEEIVPDRSARISIVAGAGNNGGDGFALAHYLVVAGRAPELWLVSGAAATRSIAARRWFEKIATVVSVHDGAPSAADLRGSALVVDAMLGTGQSGTLRGTILGAAEALAAAGMPILSVDLPTGLGGPNAVRPKWTVTFSAPKVGLTPENAGSIRVRSIGIPDTAFGRTGPGDYLAYPAPTARGRSTRIAVIGGGPYSGAPALAALAALRAGAERATVYAPEPAATAIRATSPDLVVVACGSERLRADDVPAILVAVREARVGAVVVGMGLGRAAETIEAAKLLLTELAGTVALVVDADALDALPSAGRVRGDSPIVATPNEGEFARVFGGRPETDPAMRVSRVASVARERGITVVLKGREDVIAGGDRTAHSGPHGPSVNVGGSGDVLAGVIGRLLGAGLPPILAARLATQIVDDAGRHASARLGDGLLATDLIDSLPRALVHGRRAAPLG
ncbi:MAG: NAD(P)H-hydrate dehydratase [Thermoplasmata archaeon]|nr:NAD(P)H-hydrate dehydratase [Thermoplasmata archaeon]